NERVRQLLEQHRPKPGESDLRGFEWHYLYRLSHVDLLTLQAQRAKGLGNLPADRSVAFSPDGKRLAGASGHQFITVWDAQNGKELLVLKGHAWDVTCVAFSPDGKRLASASGTSVKVLDAQTGQELLSIHGPLGKINSVAFSPDGKRLAGACGSL